jgi:4-amino-4-deoxy-L-arabinose transferase-like glycosyltransferase
MRSLLKNPGMQADSELPVSVSEPLLKARLSSMLVWTLFAVHALVLLALVLKTRPWLTGDSERYLTLADALRQEHVYGLGSGASFEPEGMRLPGYPLFIMVCHALFHDGNASIILVQCLLFLISVWLVWRVAVETLGQLTGLAFLVLSAVYPFVAFSACQISPEMPAVCLLALAFFLLMRRTRTGFAGAGACLAAAVYFRPNLLLLGPVLALACVLADRRLYRRAFLLVVVNGLMVLPWAIHNEVTFGVFTPTSVVRGSGISLFMATWQSKVSVPSLIEYGMTGRAPQELESSGMMEQVRAVNREVGVPADTVFVNMEVYPDNEKRMRAERLFTQTALANIRDWPGAYLLSSMKNMLRMWFSAHLPASLPAPVRLGLILLGLLVLLPGICGVVLALRHERGPSRLFVFAAVGALLYFTFTLCWLHTEARYTIPVRLVLLVFAAYALRRLPVRRSWAGGQS